MHFLRSFLLMLFYLQVPPPVFAQNAKYANIYTGTRIKITGKVQNTIHVWSGAAIGFHEIKDITLTLHIFSADLVLIKEKQVKLGNVSTYSLDFQDADSCYYTSITAYRPGAVNIQLLKIDQDGNMEDVTASPQLWTTTGLFDETYKFYATTRTYTSLYLASIQNNNIAQPDEADSAVFLSGGSIKGGDRFQKIIIKKVDRLTHSLLQQSYASVQQKFIYPLIAAVGSTVIACSFTEAADEATAKKGADQPSMFLAKMDTSLASAETGLLLKINKGIKNEAYIPYRIFLLQGQVMIISKGIYTQETTINAPGNQNGTGTPFTQVSNNYIPNSMRITIADSSNHLVKDTIVENQSTGSLNWDNLFIDASDSEVDILCARKYTGRKNGITHFTISSRGVIREADLIVDPQYNYVLTSAKKILPGVVLIPYTRNDKTSLIKIGYTQAAGIEQ